MTTPSGDDAKAMHDEELINIARETVDSLERITDRLERFIRDAEEARK